MSTINHAFFLNRPRVLTALMIPHHVEEERAFLVTKRIELLPIDYENFVTDLRVERDYIEKSANLCATQDKILHCLLISERGNDDGVLVVPDENGLIKHAAFFEE